MTEPTTAADRMLALLKHLDTYEEIEQGVLLIGEISVEAREEGHRAGYLSRTEDERFDAARQQDSSALSPEAEEYIAMRERGERLPSRRDLQRQLMECEDALRATESTLAALPPSAPPSALRRYTKRRTWASSQELERMSISERTAYFGARAALAVERLAEAHQQDGSALRAALERAMAAVESLPILPTQKHNRSISEAHHALTAALAALPPSAPPALDVERLALALHEERLDRWGACGDVTEAYDDHMSFHRTRAERIAAEYARLQEPER